MWILLSLENPDRGEQHKVYLDLLQGEASVMYHLFLIATAPEYKRQLAMSTIGMGQESINQRSFIIRTAEAEDGHWEENYKREQRPIRIINQIIRRMDFAL